MEQVKTIAAAKKAGTAVGAAAESALGETLTARTLEFLHTLPKGKAVKLCESFWLAFDKAAPSVRGLRRIKVTRSESMRIARGIDAGLAPVASWAESVKAAPKAKAGKGAGGGRKPRQPGAKPETKAGPVTGPSEPAKPTTSVPISSLAAGRQLVAQLVAYSHHNTSRLPVAFLDAVEELAMVAESCLKS